MPYVPSNDPRCICAREAGSPPMTLLLHDCCSSSKDPTDWNQNRHTVDAPRNQRWDKLEITRTADPSDMGHCDTRHTALLHSTCPHACSKQAHICARTADSTHASGSPQHWQSWLGTVIGSAAYAQKADSSRPFMPDSACTPGVRPFLAMTTTRSCVLLMAGPALDCRGVHGSQCTGSRTSHRMHRRTTH